MFTEYFLIVFPLHGTIENLNLNKYGLKINRFDSQYFADVRNDQGFQRLCHSLETDKILNKITDEGLEDHCYVISTTNQYNNLWAFYWFLLLIKPSTLKPIAEVRVNFVRRHGVKTLWQTTSLSDQAISFEHAFEKTLIIAGDFVLIRKIFDAYLNVSNRTKLGKLLDIYVDAVFDTKRYYKFIMLMMIIETLLPNDKEAGINYKIRRTCAVFLGQDYEMSKQIYANVGKIYTGRSKLVHNANFKAYSDEMIDYLHCMICEIFNTFLLTGIAFKDVFDIANEYGYGQRNLFLYNRGYRNDLRFISNCTLLRRVVREPKE